MATVRQNIMDAVTTRFEAVTTGGGYLTNAGNNTRVDPDKDRQPVSSDLSVAFTVRETGGSNRGGMVGEDFCTLELQIVGTAKYQASDNPDSIARKLHSDIRQAIGADKTWGGIADDTLLLDYLAEVAQGKDRVCTVTQGARIHYRTERWDAQTSA